MSRNIEALRQVYEYLCVEPFAYLEEGHMVVAQVGIDRFGAGTGAPCKDLEMHLWTFGGDGAIADFYHFTDTLQLARAMEFLGMR